MAAVIPDALMQPLLALAFIFGMFWFLYRVMRSKAIFINPDGTFKEMVISSTQRRIDRGVKGGGVYIVEPAAFVKKLIFGILPVTRIFFMFGCPQPVGFHSGKAVYNVGDLQLPVYGVLQCPKCKRQVMRIVERVGSALLRTLLYETRTASLGKPEGPKFKARWLVWLLILGGIGAIVYALFGMTAPTPVGP